MQPNSSYRCHYAADSLTFLYCAGNLLTSLNATQSPLLETLMWHGNQIQLLMLHSKSIFGKIKMPI